MAKKLYTKKEVDAELLKIETHLLKSYKRDFEVITINKDWLEKLFIDGDLHHSELGHTIISNLIIKEF